MTMNDDIVSADYFSDTIAGISSPPGRGAIGTVRISGPLAAALLEKFCVSLKGESVPFRANPRRLFHCQIVSTSGDRIDEGMAVFFPGPGSYTGEDLAEINLHGNPLLLRKFSNILTDEKSVRPPAPGEFTRRAFLNGKMDLTQAEAVRRIIDARSEFELAAGKKMLEGGVKKLVDSFRSDLLGLKAETEAEVDFSTEDLTFESREKRIEKVNTLILKVDGILEKNSVVSRLSAGCQIALSGIPNAGKSSLLNQILGWDRAIVSEKPGTTRDYLSEEIQIEGIAARIVDTAGLRETEDEIEEEGVRRSRKEIKRSQIVLHVIDGSLEQYSLPSSHPGAAEIFVINKKDILHQNRWWEKEFPVEATVLISCKSGEGLGELKKLLHEAIFQGADSAPSILLEERHVYHFRKIREALEKTAYHMKAEAPDEITAIEIDRCLEHAGEITGRITGEEILGRIFSTFCVGK